MKTLTTLSLAVLAVLLPACQAGETQADAHHPPMAAEALEPFECGSVTRLHTFEGIFLASQPAAEDFEQASMGGIRTVINMRHDAEMGDMDEQAIVEDLGLNYLHLPWNGPDEMTDGMLDDLRHQLNEAERPILLHCKSANRVGAVWLAYRALDGGLSMDEAKAEAKTVGLKSPAYEKKALDYVERHLAPIGS
ncbi:MAG: protein tyrosine phosphatase family protein [Planctomycetota bacterium]|jgi:uncharacterized protein (TIGR01244 family)